VGEWERKIEQAINDVICVYSVWDFYKNNLPITGHKFWAEILESEMS